MKLFRRHDMAPRVEMLPLIDVVFLLLTFFIFTWFMMVQANVLPVNLLPLGRGGATPGEGLHAITIDADGRLFLNQHPVSDDQFDAQLEAIAADPAEPTVYIAIEDKGRADRAPILFELWQRLQQAGIKRITFVGQPQE